MHNINTTVTLVAANINWIYLQTHYYFSIDTFIRSLNRFNCHRYHDQCRITRRQCSMLPQLSIKSFDPNRKCRAMNSILSCFWLNLSNTTDVLSFDDFRSSDNALTSISCLIEAKILCEHS